MRTSRRANPLGPPPSPAAPQRCVKHPTAYAATRLLNHARVGTSRSSSRNRAFSSPRCWSSSSTLCPKIVRRFPRISRGLPFPSPPPNHVAPGKDRGGRRCREPLAQLRHTADLPSNLGVGEPTPPPPCGAPAGSPARSRATRHCGLGRGGRSPGSTERRSRDPRAVPSWGASVGTLDTRAACPPTHPSVPAPGQLRSPFGSDPPSSRSAPVPHGCPGASRKRLSGGRPGLLLRKVGDLPEIPLRILEEGVPLSVASGRWRLHEPNPLRPQLLVGTVRIAKENGKVVSLKEVLAGAHSFLRKLSCEAIRGD
jgi:hypothetical protein